MDYKLEDSKNIFNGEVVEKMSNNEYRIKIQDNEYIIQILSITPKGMEFVMNNEFHTVKYIENQTSEMKTVVDGSPITINMNSHFDEIVYKNSGGSDTGSVQLNLRSQIPGKIISITAQEGNEIKKGDVFCVLESMKMQVSVKSHKDGIVKNIKIKEGNSVNKNDILAEIE
jgi:biotin carboxyl carrier protein